MPEYAVLDKDTIKSEIMPYLSIAKRGFTSKFDLVEIEMQYSTSSRAGVNGVFFRQVIFSAVRSRVGIQFSIITANGLWRRNGKRYIPEYSTETSAGLIFPSPILTLPTPAYRGRERTDYQGRKKRCTTNALFLSDNQGIPLAMAEPQAGNHADLFEIEDRVGEIVSQLSDADIAVDGVFCNLDAGFDGKELRSALISYDMIPNVCPNPRNGGENTEEWLYDEESYRHRWKIERTNAWMVSKPFSLGLTPQYPVGKDGTFSRLSLFSLNNFTNQISLNNLGRKTYRLRSSERGRIKKSQRTGTACIQTQSHNADD